MNTTVVSRLAACALALAASACSCGDGGTAALHPRLEVAIAADPAGEASGLLDFGPVAVGATSLRKVTLHNRGSAPLVVQPPQVGAPFARALEEPLRIPVGGSDELALAFRPTGAGESRTLVWIESNGGSRELRLVGKGVIPDILCSPAFVDFGNAILGEEVSRTVTCENRGPLDAELRAGILEGSGAGSFDVSLGAGEVLPLRAHSGATFEVHLAATRPGLLEAMLPLAAGELQLPPLGLRARAFEKAVEVLPGDCLDFGFVQLGEEREAQVLVRNAGNRPLVINSALAMGAGFASEGATAVELPTDNPDTEAAEHELAIPVSFAPPDLGSFVGALRISTDDPSSPVIDACLKGFGGGPVLRCLPASVDFGPTAIGVPLRRSFACSNVGSEVPGTDEDLLRVISVESGGDEFTATVEGEAFAAGEVFVVETTYLPQDEGVDQTGIILNTNAGSVSLPVTGEGLDLRPCSVALVPPALGFGNVARGLRAELAFEVVNQGVTECLIRDLDVEGASAFSLPGGSVELARLAPAERLRIPVAFAPTHEMTTLEGRVRLTVSNPAQPERSVALLGASLPGCVQAIPATRNFGVLEPGCVAQTLLVKLLNTCPSPAMITGLRIAAGSSAEFSVAPVSLPVELLEGDGIEVELAYAPVDEGADAGGLEVAIAEEPSPLFVPVTGVGQIGGMHEDRWTQRNDASVDVLLVIDNSGSMAGEQEAIASNMPALLDFAVSQGTDFQIGVTTTGHWMAGECPGGVRGAESGRLFPVVGSHPRILTPSTPDLDEHYAHNIQVGICHDEESGLSAAKNALSPGVIDRADDARFDEPNDGNLGFLREDAALSIVFVSDDDDHSFGSGGSYYNWFLSLKNWDTSSFSAHAIVATDESCENAAAVGSRYLDVVRRSGGVARDICTTDWVSTLQSIGTAAFATRNRFTLSALPADPRALDVRVDGVAVQRGSLGWSWDETNNQVVFAPIARPEPGQEVVVRYRIACMQGDAT